MAQVSYTVFGEVVTVWGTSVTVPWTGTPTPTGPTAAYITKTDKTVTVRFDKEVTRVNSATSWDNGFTIALSGVPTVANLVRKVAGGIEFEYETLPSTVTVAYSGSNLVDAMTRAVPAAAVSATAAAASYQTARCTLVADPAKKNNGLWYAYVSLWLTPAMSKLLADYGPVSISIGGDFGPVNGQLTTVDNTLFQVRNGAQAVCTFNVNNDASDSIATAVLWQGEVMCRIAGALDAVRVEAAAAGEPITYNQYQV